MIRSILVVLVTVLLASVANAATMYRWVDENGVTHFSKRQPPRENDDRTRLRGGNLDQAPAGAESQGVAKIRRKDLTGSGWQGCRTDLCRLVQQLDPDCTTSYCSRAKTYSEGCATFGCQTKRLAFESEVQDLVDAKKELRRQQAIDASAVPTPPSARIPQGDNRN